MVGDSIDDMTAGYRAGAATVLLVNEVNAHLATHEHTDLCIRRLDELIVVLENGFFGEVGQGEEDVDAKGMAEKALQRDWRILMLMRRAEIVSYTEASRAAA